MPHFHMKSPSNQISRQARWQRKKFDDHKCVTCGKDLEVGNRYYCTEHAEVKRTRARDRYRTKVGLVKI